MTYERIIPHVWVAEISLDGKNWTVYGWAFWETRSAARDAAREARDYCGHRFVRVAQYVRQP